MNSIVKQEATALALTDDQLIKVLQSSLYPGAAIESVKMVLGYCKAAGLDPMQKAVHLVPMWDSKAGQMRDVVMPGVNSYRVSAMRSGECAGVSEPEYGPDVAGVIGGASITYPQWCKVVVKRRLRTGEIVDFVAREFWLENYAVKGGKEKSIAPNAMWSKRPYGQIAKCAEAQALRKAFPELAAAPTAEEMEGKPMLQPDADPTPTFDYVDPAMFMAMIPDCKTDAEALKLWKDMNGKLAKQPADHAAFKAAVAARRVELKAQVEDAPVKAKTFEQVMQMLVSAKTLDALDVASDWIGDVADADERAMLAGKFDELKSTMEQAK